jgi:hypothetical protein
VPGPERGVGGFRASPALRFRLGCRTAQPPPKSKAPTRSRGHYRGVGDQSTQSRSDVITRS